MKILIVMLVLATATASFAGRRGCKIPLSKTDGFKFLATSSVPDREASKAQFGASKAWCAKSTTKYVEYLQVNLPTYRHIAAVEVKGAKWSFREFYVKSFFLGYSMDGKKWRFYKSRANAKTFTGNKDTVHSSWNDLDPSFIAKHIRIYPLQFKNSYCMKLELYGCNKKLDCTHVLRLNESQKINIASPSYPSPFANALHCNWLIHLPKSSAPVSLVSLDFDVGGSSSDQKSCARDVVRIYKSFYSFSKYLVGSYCNTTNHMMPRMVGISSEYLRIMFAGGDNHLDNHRGFNFVLSVHKDFKTVEGCENSNITLDCRGHKRNIQVTDAFYGQRQNSAVCLRNATNLNSSSYKKSCKAPDVLAKLQTTCDYRNACKVFIDKKTFPHDCGSGGPVEVFVVYQCSATEQLYPNSFQSSLLTTIKTVHSTSRSELVSSKHRTVKGVTTTAATSSPAPTPTTTPLPKNPKKLSTDDVKEESTTQDVRQPITINKEKKAEDNASKPPVILIAAVSGAVFLLVVILIGTCICLRKRRKNEKAEISKKGVVPSDSMQSKVMVDSDSLYEKIEDMEREVDQVRYEAEPNQYSPLNGMSENPLYQSGDQPNNNVAYDVPRTATDTKVLHDDRTEKPARYSSSVPKTHSVDSLKSPEELPSNSIPMAKYLEPPKSPDFAVTIPMDRYSGSMASSTGEDVYEPMDGSNA